MNDASTRLDLVPEKSPVGTLLPWSSQKHTSSRRMPSSSTHSDSAVPSLFWLILLSLWLTAPAARLLIWSDGAAPLSGLLVPQQHFRHYWSGWDPELSPRTWCSHKQSFSVAASAGAQRSEGWQFDFQPLQCAYQSATEQLHWGRLSSTGPLPVSLSYDFIIRKCFVICAVTMVTALLQVF